MVQIRSAGEAYQGPTSDVLGQVSIAEASLTSTMNWNTATFPSPIRGLSLARTYMGVWSGQGGGNAARLLVNDSAPSGVLESSDSGASWQFMTTRQMYGRVYGTYTTPGTAYNVTRNFVTHVRLVLQAGGESHARVDASVPLTNTPEVLSAYWRTDFDRNPTTTNANGDASADWAMAGGASFDTAMLINGIWYATGALETRPLHDFTQTTIVEARCRNSSLGGNGAVLRINADRQGGQYAPILIYLRRLSDETQTLSLNGKTSDAITKELFIRTRLSERIPPDSTDHRAAKQHREPGDQRRRPGHVHLSNLCAVVHHGSLPHLVRRHQPGRVRLCRCTCGKLSTSQTVGWAPPTFAPRGLPLRGKPTRTVVGHAHPTTRAPRSPLLAPCAAACR